MGSTHRFGCHGTKDQTLPNGLDCIVCGGILTGRQKKFCSSKCSKLEGRRAWIWKVYGITLEEWNVIWEYQGCCCGICRRVPRVNETFHLDHEHGGPNRGILCPYCNTRLVGRLKNAERAQQLADYLKDPPATKALGREVIAPGRPRKKKQPRMRART